MAVPIPKKGSFLIEADHHSVSLDSVFLKKQEHIMRAAIFQHPVAKFWWRAKV